MQIRILTNELAKVSTEVTEIAVKIAVKESKLKGLLESQEQSRRASLQAAEGLCLAREVVAKAGEELQGAEAAEGAGKKQLQQRQKTLREAAQDVTENEGRLSQLKEAERALDVTVAQIRNELAQWYKELEPLHKQLAELNNEMALGQSLAERFKLKRRVTLPESWAESDRGSMRKRLTELAHVVELEWCVSISTPHPEPTPAGASKPKFTTTTTLEELAIFLQRPAIQALMQHPLKPQSRGDALYCVDDGYFVILEPHFLKELTTPQVQQPPAKLSFFELLRASLGDLHIPDLVLRPEGAIFYERALGLDRVRDLEPPRSLKPYMRPYQVAGFQWLACLARNGLGAVLADDMGLGKTLQAISVILHLKEMELLRDRTGRPCPILVVVPPGLLLNWQKEFAKWAPNLVLLVYHGLHRAFSERMESIDVVLTAYHTLRADVKKFCKPAEVSFSGMILDEAQVIKNHNVQMTKAVKEVGEIIGHTRIALSGTPIENRVAELHSIFDFTNTGYLGSKQSFREEFGRCIEHKRPSERGKEKLELLKRLTRPFQLRRLKTDPSIMPDLPDKISVQENVALTPQQAKLYNALVQEWQKTMKKSRDTSQNHAFERRAHVFTLLNKARLVCAHPACLAKEDIPKSCSRTKVEEKASESGKTERLMELLDGIFTNSEEEKVLVFVSRKPVMYLLRDLIQQQHPSMVALTFSGDISLKERAQQEKRFSEDALCRVMVLTVQAGGVGLNLTAANHVIHFDRCYNPAREAQATDRSHRLGQKLKVMEHRLITEGTFEERLEEIMRRKSELSNLTITGSEDWIADYSDKELAELFMLRTGLAPEGRKRALEAPVSPPLGAASPLDCASPDSAPKPCSPPLQEDEGSQEPAHKATAHKKRRVK